MTKTPNLILTDNEGLPITKATVLLAKLFAEENITVVQNDASTASFDVRSRVLTIPMWNKATDAVHMMLIAHEVGHALYTPTDGWTSIKDKYSEIGFDLFNIVEDPRIEKLMIRKFPGLWIDFKNAYANMIANGFFGADVANKISSYGFADRINTYAKVMGQVEVPFSKAEKVLVDRVMTTETWDDVVAVTVDIHNHIKSHTKKIAIPTFFDDFGDGSDTGEDFSIEFDGAEKPSEEERSEPVKEGQTIAVTDEMIDARDDDAPVEKNDPTGAVTAGVDIGQDDNQEYTAPDDDEEDEYTEDQTVIKTVYAGTEHLASLSDSSALGGEYAFGKSIKAGTDLKTLYKPYSEIATARKRSRPLGNHKAAVKRINVAADQMVREFEMRRSADRLSRSALSTRGSLDVNKLHRYKFDDHLFRQVTTLADGQSHAMVMLIDFSGSMHGEIKAVLTQSAILATFCRKARIPFRTLLFTSGSNSYSSDAGHIDLCQVGMYEICSSELTNDEFKTAIRYMAAGNKKNIAGRYYMAGTPLAPSVIVANELLRDLMKSNQTQKGTLVVLTDGCGDSLRVSGKVHNAKLALDMAGCKRLFMERGHGTTSLILDHLRKSDINTIGYKLESYPSSSLYPTHTDMTVKYGMLYGKNVNGFDAEFIIDTARLNGTTAKLSKTSTTKEGAERDLASFLNSKNQSRMIARNVAETMS